MQNKRLDDFEYSFWFFSSKLDAILTMLAELIDYPLCDEEREIIKLELQTTDDEKEIWSEYSFENKRNVILINFAKDHNADIVFIKIKTSQKFKENLETINMIQELFSEFKK